RKAARAFARGPVAAGAGRASRERADQYLAGVAAGAARRLGYPDLGTLVLARTGAGASLAAISHEAGLHKDWLSRYLERLDPSGMPRPSGPRGWPGTWAAPASPSTSRGVARPAGPGARWRPSPASRSPGCAATARPRFRGRPRRVQRRGCRGHVASAT
ncbi:MAG: hypothetical protein ACRDRJ_43585, partial [Streptosporangiaceae bacterium]